MTYAQRSSSTTETSPMKKLKREKFALLARVGHHKRNLSALQDEANFYSTIVTALLADYEVALRSLEAEDLSALDRKQIVMELTSRRLHLTRQLLNFSPPSSESLDRIWNLLNSDGLATSLVTTPEGWLSLSSDLILGSVERAIEVTKQLNQKH